MHTSSRCLLLATAAITLLPSFTKAEYSFSTLVSFDRTNGASPSANLLADDDGNIYGTTEVGGAYNVGTVFKIAAETNEFSTLVTFSNSNGAYPQAGLISDAGGNLYGTTYVGGTNGYGTAYKIAAGTNALTTLANFNRTNGANPTSTLVLDAAGNLYGTTSSGGANGYGTVFEIVARTHAVTTLYSLAISYPFSSAGANPQAGLVSDAAGNMYGTTFAGGEKRGGAVFEITAGSHSLVTLYSFDITAYGLNRFTSLISDAAGNLFGTTYTGGAHSWGTVFKIDAETHSFSTLYSFNGADGGGPHGSLLVDSEGNLYGTTYLGGANNLGTVFKIAAGTNSLTTLHSFSSADGQPYAGLIADDNGNLFGTTTTGGAFGYGTVFKLSVVPESSSLILASLSVIIFARTCFCRFRQYTDR